MKTVITLTNEGVVTVNIEGEVKTISDEEFYSKRSKVYRHIDMEYINRDYEGEWFVVQNDRDELITLEAISDETSKLTQIIPGDSLKLHHDNFYYD